MFNYEIQDLFVLLFKSSRLLQEAQSVLGKKKYINSACN